MTKFARTYFQLLMISFLCTILSNTEAFALQQVKNPELQTVKNSIVFVLSGSPVTDNAAPLGTGFIVGLRLKSNPETMYKFVITNAHVLAKQKVVTLRINNSSNTAAISYPTDLASSALFPSEKTVDLAAIAIPDIPDTNPTVFDYSYILGHDDLKKAEIEEGTDVVATGYLQPYAGIAKNFPVMRFGKIALLTDEHWFNTVFADKQQGYIVEIYNVGGSSGSPVVLQPSQVRVNSQNVFQQRRIPPYLVGVIKGHPNDLAELKEVVNLQLKPIPDKYAVISAGVAVIEPAENLRKFLQEIAAILETKGQPVILTPVFSDEKERN